MDRGRVLFISLPKGRHPRIVGGVNEKVTAGVLKKRLKTSETFALPGGGSVGTRRWEKWVQVPPQGLL